MVGLSHVALRLLVRRYLPVGARTLWPTEMLSSWRLPKEDLGATAETLMAEGGEDDLVPQILGNEEEPIRQSVQKLAAWGARGVDINMGCPVKKALKHNYGVALMGDQAYAAEVVRMTVKHSPIPVSVKLRAGLQNDQEFLLRFVRGLEEAGAAWITLHPRIGHMKRRGAADWSQVRLVREALGIPVIGNGDVQCVEDVFSLNEVSGCDAVMVGRALAARPWLLWQVGEALGFSPPPGFAGQRAPHTPFEEGAEYGRALIYFIDLLAKYFDFEAGAKRFRFHVRMTGGWLEWGQNLYSIGCKAKDYVELRAESERFFASPQKMYARTQLRE
ncbi:MAG: tRNA-dihydrouridine synthase family protein [Bdellovibrionales bacterium]|nr:tRNA-dihydrouridine synthase family protein [Bdellovibrionales bacterium]